MPRLTDTIFICLRHCETTSTHGGTGRPSDPYPLIYFSFQPVCHNWWNKDRRTCSPVYGMVCMNKVLLVIGKRSPRSSGSEFHRYLSGPLPYVRRHVTVNKMSWVKWSIFVFPVFTSIAKCIEINIRQYLKIFSPERSFPMNTHTICLCLLL